MSIVSLQARGAAAAALATALTGCAANMSGLDAGSTYGCKAPEGVKCDSVSGVYYNAVQNNLPSQQRKPLAAPPVAAPGMMAARASFAGAAPSAGPALIPAVAARPAVAAPAGYVPAPLRAAPRVYRLWIKPWEDADRDLNSESLLYVHVDNGRWMLDHVQRQVRDAYAPVRPGKSPTTAANSTGAEIAAAEQRPPALSPLDTNASVQQALSSLRAQQPSLQFTQD